MEAFVVVAGYRPYHREITPAGFTYMSDDDSRIRINFPQNCFSRPCIVQFRVSINLHTSCTGLTLYENIFKIRAYTQLLIRNLHKVDSWYKEHIVLP